MEKTENLFLILTGQWYNMIEADIKKEEYRALTTYWSQTRKLSERNRYKTVTFQLGYSKKRRMKFEIDGPVTVGFGRSEWGALYNERYFKIKLGRKLL